MTAFLFIYIAVSLIIGFHISMALECDEILQVILYTIGFGIVWPALYIGNMIASMRR